MVSFCFKFTRALRACDQQEIIRIAIFVYNNSITIERMINIFSQELDKKGINYPFHFNTGIYETNDYGEGGSKMYKGYMPQILEDKSKETNFIVTRDTYKETLENESEME